MKKLKIVKFISKSDCCPYCGATGTGGWVCDDCALGGRV